MSTHNDMGAGRLFGIPLRLHWSFLVMTAVMLAMSGFQIVAGLGSLVAYVVLILAHELGHALVGRLWGERVVSITLFGYGGECQLTATHPSRLSRETIAWAGVLAQALIYCLTALLAARFTIAEGTFFRGVMRVFTTENAIFMGINLLPIRPIDGRTAWPLLWHPVRRWRARRASERALADALSPKRRRR